jgi:hypothetical protein
VSEAYEREFLMALDVIEADGNCAQVLCGSEWKAIRKKINIRIFIPLHGWPGAYRWCRCRWQIVTITAGQVIDHGKLLPSTHVFVISLCNFPHFQLDASSMAVIQFG